jgi:hypothetical protein
MEYQHGNRDPANKKATGGDDTRKRELDRTANPG